MSDSDSDEFDFAEVYGTTTASTRGWDAGRPHVWWQDAQGTWHYVSASFEAYYRLACLHLGILGWQGVFTPLGLPHGTRQWLRFFSPERLALDLDAHEELMRTE